MRVFYERSLNSLDNQPMPQNTKDAATAIKNTCPKSVITESVLS